MPIQCNVRGVQCNGGEVKCGGEVTSVQRAMMLRGQGRTEIKDKAERSRQVLLV